METIEVAVRNLDVDLDFVGGSFEHVYTSAVLLSRLNPR